MTDKRNRNPPGAVRDAIVAVLSAAYAPLDVSTIHRAVVARIGTVPESSVRSYLLLNTPDRFVREGRGLYSLRRGNETEPDEFRPETRVEEGAPALFSQSAESAPVFRFGKAELVNCD